MKRPTLALIFGLAVLALGGCTYETSDYGPYGYSSYPYGYSSYSVGNCGLSRDCSRGFYDSAGWWHDRYR